METKKLLERLVSDPEEIKELFDKDPQLKKHIHFGLQINIDDRNGRNQDTLYNDLFNFIHVRFDHRTLLIYHHGGHTVIKVKHSDQISIFLKRISFNDHIRIICYFLDFFIRHSLFQLLLCRVDIPPDSYKGFP